MQLHSFCFLKNNLHTVQKYDSYDLPDPSRHLRFNLWVPLSNTDLDYVMIMKISSINRSAK
jgi:hypothetical protein